MFCLYFLLLLLLLIVIFRLLVLRTKMAALKMLCRYTESVEGDV